MKTTILILDLDRVLITTPNWKVDKIHPDGYSDFNPKCVKNLNKLLEFQEIEIILSSARRKSKTLEEFNEIFKNRNINNIIKEYIPIYKTKLNRKQEIENFINKNKINNFLIIDDDKSLNDTTIDIKNNLILTNYLIGFDEAKLNEALLKLETQQKC